MVLLTSVSYAQMINELQPNPNGSDPANQNVELKGTPNTTFQGYILSLECDASSIGTIDELNAVNVTFDNDGLAVVSIPDLENPSFTIVLVDNTFSGALGDDLDTDNDGVIDASYTNLGVALDAIGVSDNTADESNLYGTQLNGANFAYTGGEPALIFRDGDTDAWYAVNGTAIRDINATVVTGGFPSGSDTPTFGSINPEFDETLSIATTSTQDFVIYPNPVTNGVVTIANTIASPIAVTVFNVLGKQVLRANITNTLNVSNLKAGLYVLQVSQNGNTTTKKLVIK